MLNEEKNTQNKDRKNNAPTHEPATHAIAAAALHGAEVTRADENITYFIGKHLRSNAGPGDLVIEDMQPVRRIDDTNHELPAVPKLPAR